MSKQSSSNGSAAKETEQDIDRTPMPDMDTAETASVDQEPAGNEENGPGERVEPRFTDLLGIATDAIKIRPPLLISSIFGLPWTWIPPYRRYSEFRILDLWRLRRTIKYLINVTVPSIPRTPPPFGPPVLNTLFWLPSVVLQRPDHNGNYTTFPEEAWFFINGIMTNDSLAQVNAAYMSYLFHRPLTLIQNSTDSFAIDMLQCMLGKEWAHVTEPVIKAFPVIYDALKSPHKRRVVVIAHSQGTIIVANVLRLLYESADRWKAAELEELAAVPEYAGPEFIYPDQAPLDLDEFDPLSEEELAKLEVYCFATCANTFGYYDSRDPGKLIPWIEHFGNEYDIVARLGMLAPNQELREVRIEGPRYVHRHAWGHFLNEHYLFNIEDHQKSGRRPGGKGGADPFELVDPESLSELDVNGPRLFQYINGGSPKD